VQLSRHVAPFGALRDIYTHFLQTSNEKALALYPAFLNVSGRLFPPWVQVPVIVPSPSVPVYWPSEIWRLLIENENDVPLATMLLTATPKRPEFVSTVAERLEPAPLI
jgi:hypothetical protein